MVHTSVDHEAFSFQEKAYRMKNTTRHKLSTQQNNLINAEIFQEVVSVL